MPINRSVGHSHSGTNYCSNIYSSTLFTMTELFTQGVLTKKRKGSSYMMVYPFDSKIYSVGAAIFCIPAKRKPAIFAHFLIPFIASVFFSE